MSRFKVGDRVVIVSSTYDTDDDGDPNLSAGNAGEVIEVVGDGCALKMDNGPRRTNELFGEGWFFDNDELRHENEGGAK